MPTNKKPSSKSSKTQREIKRQSWPLVLDDKLIVQSAGGIVLRGSSISIRTPLQTLIIHRPRHKDWSFPKGRLEPGETSEATALREVQEETGYACVLGEFLATVRYIDRNGHPKEVRFWKMVPRLAKLKDPIFIPNNEVDVISWMTFKDAFKRLTHSTDRILLKRAFA